MKLNSSTGNSNSNSNSTSSSNSNSIGIGIVGTGIMGGRMAAAITQHARFHVAAVWDPDTPAAERAALAYGGAAVAGSLQALTEHAGVDAVYIASPPAFHLQGVQAAIAAGKPCLCEKPLAHSVAGAQALCDAVAAAGLPLAVNFPFARGQSSRGLQALLQGGDLGVVEQATLKVRFAQWPREWQASASSWLAGPEQGGFTREVLSHFVFLAHRLFGPAQVQGVRLQRLPGAAETSLQATLVHAHTTLHIDAAVAGEVADFNRLELLGSKANATLSSWERLEYLGQVSDGVPTGALTLDAFAQLIEGRDDHGLASADEALAVVRSIEFMLSAEASVWQRGT